MSAWPSDTSQYGAGQFHPEFGYFAPTMRFWGKAWLALKGVALGALAGAVAMFFLTMEREEKALTMLATPVVGAPPPPKPAQIAMPAQVEQSPAASTYTWVPVRFLPESMALPATTPRTPKVTPPQAAVASAPTPQAPAAQEPSTVGASPAASMVAATPIAAPAPAATPAPATALAPTAAPEPAAAPVAKAVAKPRKKIVREPPPPEPEPRAAFAGPPRSFILPIFGFGWQR